MTTCNRTTRKDFKPRMYYTCNPGNVGHGWVKRLFIDRRMEDGERAEDYAFIPASIYDNEILLSANPEYLRALESLPEDMRPRAPLRRLGRDGGAILPRIFPPKARYRPV